MAENKTPGPDESEASQKSLRMTAGQEFAKKITPIGCILILVVFIAFLSYCFRSGKAPIPGYTAPHDSIYYAQSGEALKQLQTELEINVFPKLGGVEGCTIEDRKLDITIDRDHYNDTRAGILHYYDEALFTFSVGT